MDELEGLVFLANFPAINSNIENLLLINSVILTIFRFCGKVDDVVEVVVFESAGNVYRIAQVTLHSLNNRCLQI
jgi:hypothetical protein